MPRAKRYHIPGYVWHLTHRCHKREFLLKFERDRRRWLQWLFEAKKRYGVSILNYSVTSNHVHLILIDPGDGKAIARSVQLVAGRTAQEYNQRKKRSGAFWSDRYHATAVDTGKHLRRCVVYVDLNMVRAGVVDHPSHWNYCGYNEIQKPKKRYRLIDEERLAALCRFDNIDRFRESHATWVEDALKSKRYKREPHWTQSVGVGTNRFIRKLRKQLGHRTRGRQVTEKCNYTQLKDPADAYIANFDAKNMDLSYENLYVFNEKITISNR